MMQGRAKRHQGALLAMFTLLILGLVVHIWEFYFSPANNLSFHTSFSPPLPARLAEHTPQLMHDLWTPFIHDINTTHFLTKEGYHYNIPHGTHHWQEPSGKKLLILDVDTRLDTGPGAMMNESSLNSNEMTGRTAGMMNHYLYAMIHGYNYRFIRAPPYPNRHGTWVKVPMIKEALKTHEIVVFLDADAIFMYPEMPFEWLMSLWNVTDNTLVAMASDPNSPRNRDANGRVMHNTGFIIAQQSNRTQELFHNWEQCPTDKKYKGCKRWAKDWAHEQAAFSNYVRYDYNSTEEVVMIPCMDGNGAPYIGDKTCGGVFVRHHWFHKDYPAKDLLRLMQDAFVSWLHAGFHHDKQDNFIDAGRFTYPLRHLNV
ncbi:hypothetical protein NCS55_00480400 [Fusarium keratoplasticum]|nr:hypothetical protein NCS55_00480400 [Fusarium keratoplasticum]